MTTLGYIILFTLIGSIFSLVGGMLLLAKEKFAKKLSHYLFSFAAGVLLGTAFFDLLPEASEEALHHTEEGAAEVNIFVWTFIGFIFFFLLVRFIHWFHHHDDHKEIMSKSIIPLLILGDTLHNFIDGVVIAATFLVSIPLGIVTSLAVAAHEIPQEIGDFAIFLHRGMKKKNVLLINVFSAFVSIAGALLTYWFGELIEGGLPIFLSITAGFFIYIAASDLIPEIHNEEKRSVAFTETLLLIAGALTIWLAVSLLEGVH